MLKTIVAQQALVLQGVLTEEKSAQTRLPRPGQGLFCVVHTTGFQGLFLFGFRILRLFFTYKTNRTVLFNIRLIEYDHWEQFESTQRLPQRRPLIHVKEGGEGLIGLFTHDSKEE
jgi:hypothetical protein